MHCVLKRLVNKSSFKNKILPVFEKNKRFSSNVPGIIGSGLADVEIPHVSLHEFVSENVGNWENHIATECAVTGRNYTFKQVVTKSKNLSGTLRKKLKLEKGDVIAVILPNVPEFSIIALGVSYGGLICTTVNPIYTPDEISKQLSEAGTKAIITLTDFWPLGKAVNNVLKKDIPIITINSQKDQTTPSGALNFAEFTENQVDFENVTVSSDDPIFLPYSSGTTGMPKGVPLTHFNIISNVCQLAHPLVGVNYKTTSSYQDVTPAVLPLFHIYGLTILCWYQMKLGCKVITVPKFTPELYVGTLRKHKPDVLYFTPPIAIFLANHPSVKKEDFDGLRAVVNGAASLGALDMSKLIKKAERNLAILQGYGLTETSPAVLCTSLSHVDDQQSFGSLGKPLPNTLVKIIASDDPTGTPLGPNQPGELLVKGPQVMKGYFKRPEENANVFLDGWMRTGDMMYYNDAGYFFIKDRLKELIKVKGFQVAPAELEEIIRNFPNVADAAVIGIPHEGFGEVPRAYITAKPGAKVDCDKLMACVKEKVAPFKQLKGGVSVVDNIPKSAAGKILRKELLLKYQKEGV